MPSNALKLASRVRLNNNVLMPVLGFGTWRLHGPEVVGGVDAAIRTGLRLIDTASMYANEAEVGQAIRRSGVDRKELFITSKLWAHEHGREGAKAACAQSLDRLRMDYLDLYLIHWPSGGRNVETWQGMIELMEEGRVRSIGVSNFSMDDIAPLVQETGTVPAVNQVEFSPYSHNDQLLADCSREGIQLEAYSPLSSTNLHDPALMEMARSHERTPAQVVLRWCLQKGTVVLFKSSHEERIKEDSDLFGFRLSSNEVRRLDSLY
ncbi:MAG: aldo/keto reductase [Candidatus Saccharibacteria bacterium]